jgi:hypothetical protein
MSGDFWTASGKVCLIVLLVVRFDTNWADCSKHFRKAGISSDHETNGHPAGKYGCWLCRNTYLQIKGLKMRVCHCVMLAALFIIGSASVSSGRHPDVTGDPRPDLVPHPLYNNWTSFRADYNRPSYLGGWMAYHLSRTSQEAMSWQENRCNGTYHTHCPTPVTMYYYPKPWEVLPVGARHNVSVLSQPTQVNPEVVPTTPEHHHH